MENLLFIITNILGGFYLAVIIGGITKRVRRPDLPEAENYLVVVVTVGTPKVLPALRETVTRLEQLGLRYVVVSSNVLPFRNVILVPREEDGSKYRAVLYFVKRYVREDTWYIFLDDDSYPLDRTFLKDIAYYSSLGCVAGNGVLVPRPGRSKLAYALDWVRYFDDLTRFRFALEVLRKPIFGIHGELLIVRGDVLKEVWPAMGESVTEDFRLAMELLKRKYKTFQSATRVSIKSPNSLGDFIRQRARWANSLRDMVTYKNASALMATTASIAMWVTAPLWLIYGVNLAMLVTIYFLAIYTYSSIKAGRYVIDVLLMSLLEPIAMSIGLARRMRQFYVIDKT
ncbi:MAG: glycosyltransferase family 2 protein [Pyrobaculum sp.]